MKKQVYYALLWLVVTLVSLNQLQAQELLKQEEPPKLGRFVTLELTDLGFSSGYNIVGGTLDYEQFLSSNLSFTAGVNYMRSASKYIAQLNPYEEGRSMYKEVQLTAGLRYRVLSRKKFSLLARAEMGVAFGRSIMEPTTVFEGDVISSSRVFGRLGLGAEYRFSDRVKATAEWMWELSSNEFTGSVFSGPALRLGLQIRLGQ